MVKSKSLSSRDEVIHLLSLQHPQELTNEFSSSSANDLLVDMSYGQEGVETQVKELGLNLLIDTKRTPVGEVSGFRGQMFADSQQNIYVVIRGTSTSQLNTLLNNVITNLSIIATGEFDTRYLKELNDFAKIIRDYSNSSIQPPKIYIHGHSLGGGAAQHLGLLLSMTAPAGQSVVTLTSDPIATEELSTKAMAAYKELKISKEDGIVDIHELTSKVNQPEINDLVDKYFSRDAHDRYEERRKILDQELESKCRIINLIPAEENGEKLQFSSAALIHRQPGASVVAIREKDNAALHDRVEEDNSLLGSISNSIYTMFASGVSSEKSQDTGLVENITRNIDIHDFSKMMKATKFLAIKDSTFLHTELYSQLYGKFNNNIDFDILVNHAVPMEEVVAAPAVKQVTCNKVRLKEMSPSIKDALSNMEVSLGQEIYPSGGISSKVLNKGRRRD